MRVAPRAPLGDRFMDTHKRVDARWRRPSQGIGAIAHGVRLHYPPRASRLTERAARATSLRKKVGRSSLVSLKETRWMRGTHMFSAPPPPQPLPLSKHKNKSTCITFKILFILTFWVAVSLLSRKLPVPVRASGTRAHPGAQCWRSYLAPSPSLAMARGRPPWPWFARGQPPWPWRRPLPPPDATLCSEASSTVS